MGARKTNETVKFILPDNLWKHKTNKNIPEVEEAIKNVERLIKSNTIDFVEIETETITEAMKESNIDGILRMIPIYLRDVKELISKLKGNK